MNRGKQNSLVCFRSDLNTIMFMACQVGTVPSTVQVEVVVDLLCPKDTDSNCQNSISRESCYQFLSPLN